MSVHMYMLLYVRCRCIDVCACVYIRINLCSPDYMPGLLYGEILTAVLIDVLAGRYVITIPSVCMALHVFEGRGISTILPCAFTCYYMCLRKTSLLYNFLCLDGVICQRGGAHPSHQYLSRMFTHIYILCL